MGTTIARRFFTALTVAMLLTGTGCGDDDRAATIRSEPVPPIESSRGESEAASEASDQPGPADTGEASDETDPDETTATAVVFDDPFAPRPGPMTNEGMPSTLIAVTANTYELVEIDWVDSQIARSVGSTGSNGEDFGNFIDGAWWHPASGVVVVSDGPEPAAGNLTLLEPGEEYERQGGPESWGQGWDVAISPDGRFALTTGYGADVAMLAKGTGGRTVVVDLVDSPDEYFRYHPAWLRDRIGVAVVREVEGIRNVIDVIELGEDGRGVSTVSHKMDRPIADLEVRSDGSLVVLYDDGQNPFGGGTRAVVVDPDSGQIKAEFDLEPGSHSLAYDATGSFLLYVDGQGTVRWQGSGRSGVLGEGYIHADW